MRILETITLSSASHRDLRSLIQTERGSGEWEKDGGTLCGLILTRSTFRLCVLVFDCCLEASELKNKKRKSNAVFRYLIKNSELQLLGVWLKVMKFIKAMFFTYFNCTQNLHTSCVMSALYLNNFKCCILLFCVMLLPPSGDSGYLPVLGASIQKPEGTWVKPWQRTLGWATVWQEAPYLLPLETRTWTWLSSSTCSTVITLYRWSSLSPFVIISRIINC